MSRSDANRAAEMETFVRVVERGDFSAAARALGHSPSAVSKLVTRLEARLGAQLMTRTTRRLQLTAEGEAFYERATRILADLDEAEREAAGGAAPRGRVRVNCSVSFGQMYVLPLTAAFLARFPEVTLDIVLTDQVVDLVEQRADVAIRIGPLASSRLVARKLGQSRMAVVASPEYLARHGIPQTVEDLERHPRIGFNFTRTVRGWPFLVDGRTVTVPPIGPVRVGDGETSRLLALAGVGLARHALFHIGPDIAAGTLVPVLEDLNPGDIEEIHAVFVGRPGRLPARTRAFLDFVAEAAVDMNRSGWTTPP
ncbi:LysR family transcriptional regulator [Methylopila sp. 73B]|uniref:LysR family transcriptional regulator n=1 Tax=Methylopila sp. 73B TaxID=1120792 RepID=UPI000363732A|nr:LysR family transcriptional regulator [Methylopila sp. 73B]